MNETMMFHQTTWTFISSIVLWNIIVFLRFGWDKFAAVRRYWRVSEAELLFLSFLGATPGAKLAQRVWKHKTTKQPFARNLNTIVCIHIFVLLLGGISLLFPKQMSLVSEFLSNSFISQKAEAGASSVTVNRGLDHSN